MGRLPGELLPKLGWLSIICSRKSSPIVGLLYTIIIIDVSLFDRKIIVNSFISYLLYWVATSHGQLFVFDHSTTGSSKSKQFKSTYVPNSKYSCSFRAFCLRGQLRNESINSII